MSTSQLKRLATAAIATVLVTLVACGSDIDATSPAGDNFASEPTPPPAIENLTAEQVLERAKKAMDEAQSFEAVVNVTTVRANEVFSTDRSVRMSSPERVYVYSELDDHVTEVILFDGLRASRNAESSRALEQGLWEETYLAYPPGFEEVSYAFQKFDREEPFELAVSDTGYVLTGTTERYFLSGGCCVGSEVSLEHIQGPFEAHIDPVTFAPTSIQYESGWAYVDRADPSLRTEILITVAIDFLTFNEPVTVTPPPPGMVIEAAAPTATLTAGATQPPRPGVLPTPTPIYIYPTAFPTATPMVISPVPTATPAPFEPIATATAAPSPTGQMGRTPTPHPPTPPSGPPPLFTPIPGTPVDEFKAEIAAAPPSDVFELEPGLVLVYQPCSMEPDDGVITAKLFDLGDPEEPPRSSSYMALIYIDLSAGTWTSESPGRTSTVRISDALEDTELMQEVVARADPAVRCG